MRTFLLVSMFCFCWACTPYGDLRPLAELPGGLNEVSGMVVLEAGSVWVIEDGGNPDELLEVSLEGELLKSFEVSHAKNRDWEALTADSQGHVYIGDFGNNANDRKNLRIYKLPDPRVEKGDKIPAEHIDFAYPDQEEFPPPNAMRRFDAEAFFHTAGYLYIITKNRSRPFDGKAGVYRIPDRPGKYTAEKLGEIELCGQPRNCQVTDAALSPSGDRLALLGYGSLWIYEGFQPGELTGRRPRRIVHKSRTQLEGVCFANDSLLYLTDEVRAGTGGNLYAFPLPEPVEGKSPSEGGAGVAKPPRFGQNLGYLTKIRYVVHAPSEPGL